MGRSWILATLVIAACGDAASTTRDATAAGPDAGSPPADAGRELPDATAPEGSGDAAVVTADSGSAGLRVLFIGNSYTYVNDLPGMLARIATTSGTAPAIAVDEVVQGSATLQDHFDNGIAQTRLAEGPWTHVVLQGQSLEAVYPDDAHFAAGALELGELAIAAGARPTLFVTWARAAGDPMYDPCQGLYGNPQALQDRITFQLRGGRPPTAGEPPLPRGRSLPRLAAGSPRDRAAPERPQPKDGRRDLPGREHLPSP